jgi:hypothetical protein
MVSREIDQRSRCLHSCATATNACFLSFFWDAAVGRQLCVLLERARIGPFVASGAGPG